MQSLGCQQAAVATIGPYIGKKDIPEAISLTKINMLVAGSLILSTVVLF